MTGARIFISHSAKEPAAAALLEQLYDELTAAGFDVFVDRERLKDGTDWRNDIYIAALRSHGAILLLSEAAATQSDWVIAEAGVIAARRWGDPGYRLFVIVVPDAKPEMLGSKRFEPFDFARIQTVAADAPDLVQRVLTFFQPLQFAATAFDVLAELVASELPADQRVLETAAEKLGVAVDVASPANTAPGVARALFHCDLKQVYEALKALGGRMTKEARSKVAEIVVPFWVDPRAVVALARVALNDPPRRVLVLNASKPAVGRMYVSRAAVQYPLDWLVLPVTDTGGDDLAGAIVSEIRDAFRKTDVEVEDYSDSDVDDAIAATTTLHPVILLLPSGVPLHVVERVRQDYPLCTLLILTGNSIPDPSAADVVVLDPPLAPGRETEVHTIYLASRRL